MVPIPDRMKHLPLHTNGLPIHFTVGKFHGKISFKDQARDKQIEAVNKNLCHLCGKRMTAPYWFICGGDEVELKQTKDGPMHEECARYAIAACPFLANPNYVGKRKTEDSPNPLVRMWIYEHPEFAGAVTRLESGKWALCTAGSYTGDYSERYVLFHVPEWLSADYSAIPQNEEACRAQEEAARRVAERGRGEGDRSDTRGEAGEGTEGDADTHPVG